MRQIVESDLAAFLEWLGIPVEGTPTILPDTFTAETRYVDLIAEVGPDRLLHVEYVHTPKTDLAIRMLGYRAVIMAAHEGKSLTQYAIIMKDGRVPSCDDPENGFSLGFHPIYLRDHPPEPLRKGIALAALSSLAQGDTATRAEGLADAYARIQTLPETEIAALLEAADVLATIRLDPNTIEQIRKELGMSVKAVADFYSQTEAGRELMHRAEANGQAQMLEALLRDRFGDQPGIATTAGHLAETGDLAAAAHLVTHAQTFDDLRSA